MSSFGIQQAYTMYNHIQSRFWVRIDLEETGGQEPMVLMDCCKFCTMWDGRSSVPLDTYCEGALSNLATTFTRQKLTICQAIKAAKEEAGQCELLLGWQPWPFSPQATRLATLEARKDASKSLEKKVLQKAMEDAKVRGCWCWFFVGRFVSPGVCFFLEKQIECLVYKFMSSFRDDLGPQSTWEPQIPWLYGRVMSWSGNMFQKFPKQIHRFLNHHLTFSPYFTMKSYKFPAFLRWKKHRIPPSPRPKLSWAQRPRPKPLPRPKLRKSPRQRFGHDLVTNGAQKCSNLAKVGWKFSPNMSQLLGSWYFDDAWFILMFVFVLLMSNYLDVICWDLRMSWSGPMVLMWVDMKSPCRGTFALASNQAVARQPTDRLTSSYGSGTKIHDCARIEMNKILINDDL